MLNWKYLFDRVYVQNGNMQCVLLRPTNLYEYLSCTFAINVSLFIITVGF